MMFSIQYTVKKKKTNKRIFTKNRVMGVKGLRPKSLALKQ